MSEELQNNHSGRGQIVSEQDIHVELTHEHLDIHQVLSFVKRDEAGAIVIFTGEI